MSITSYAQNFEDVMLWRALGHIERGTYIDVGAQDPVIDSVSLAFHEHGWRGIHVEPTPHYAELLRQQRPGDTVIQAAVGKGPALLQFFEIPDTGISTADPTIAAQHRERGFKIHEITVSCISLADVFKTCTEQEIHWLKIDVEGFEKQVLSSWSPSSARPWIVVVESTLPGTQIETHKSWEPILISYGYIPVYFDGLNKYYVSDAHPEINNAFLVPPNLFDGFTLNGTSSSLFHKVIEDRYQEKINETLAQSEQQRKSSQTEADRLNAHLSLLAETHAAHQQNWLQTQQALSEQNSQARQELDALLRTQAQREHEVAVQLRDIQQQTAQGKADLTHSYDERERALHGQHTEQKQALNEKLQALQEQLGQVQKERITREKALHEQTSQARKEVENILRTQVQREQSVVEKLEAIRSKAAQENAEIARTFFEQHNALHSLHAASEQALNKRLDAGQEKLQLLQQERIKREQTLLAQASDAKQEIENLLRTQVQREREVSVQLLAWQKQAAQEKVELTGSHLEQERALRHQLSKQEDALNEQVRKLKLELVGQANSSTQRENTLNSKIASLQTEKHAIHQASQLEAQQHNIALSADSNERARLLNAYSVLEAELREEIRSGQQANLDLKQLLADAQLSLKVIHTSLTWRAGSPLRKLASMLHISKTRSLPSKVLVKDASYQLLIPVAYEPEPVTPLSSLFEPAMPTPPQATYSPPLKKASTLSELLAHDGENFVQCSYITLLGREPDSEGMGYYLNRLKIGISKMEMIAQLCLSFEGKNTEVNLPELAKSLDRYKRIQIPLIGWIFRRSDQVQNTRAALEAIRTLKKQIVTLNEQHQQRLALIEQSISALHTQFKRNQTGAVTESSNTTPINEPVDTTGDETNLVSTGFHRVNPIEKEIYFQLISAISLNKTREGDK